MVDELHTGQVPPEMILSKDKASGMPEMTPEPVVPIELIVDPPNDFGFSSPLMEARAEST